MKTVYFDACTYDDYDKIVRYLLEKKCLMANRNKADMSLAAMVPPELPSQMLKDVEFDETVTYGDKPLDERFIVPENYVWA